MRTPSRLRRLLTAALVATVASLGVSSTATASPKPQPSDHVRLTIDVPASKAHPNTVVVICTVYFNPAPQYSATSGKYGSVHWGAKMICETPGTLIINAYLYANSALEEEVDFDGAGTELGDTWPFGCFNKTLTNWHMSITASWDGDYAEPNPAVSSSYALTCG